MQRVAVLMLVVAALPVRADVAPPPPPPAPAPVEAPADDASAVPTAVRRPKANQRILCGCASSRFLGVKGPTVVGNGTHGAWLHGEAAIGAFAAGDAGKLAPSSLPFAIDVDDRSTAGASRLVKLRATGEGAGLLGITRPGDPGPRDVATVTLAPSASTDAPAPGLKALWLEPAEARERRDCGPWLTQRIAFEAVPGSAPIDAFLVTDLDSGARTLVDARHAGAFGIGRVEVCDHGFRVENRPQRLEIAPVSSTGATGPAWGFAHDGTGTTPVVRITTPPTADADQLDTPYPVPGVPTQAFSWMSVGGFWIILVVTGVVASLLGFIAWRLKRRRLAEIVCASCQRSVPVDVLDEKTDGFFCPHCGASGMWKGRRVDVDVTRL
jgi:DNA-directed RNA polymerase subunit RPC12/RpoP